MEIWFHQVTVTFSVFIVLGYYSLKGLLENISWVKNWHIVSRGLWCPFFYSIPFFLILPSFEVLLISKLITTSLNTSLFHVGSYFLLLITFLHKKLCGLLNVASWLAGYYNHQLKWSDHWTILTEKWNRFDGSQNNLQEIQTFFFAFFRDLIPPLN